VKATWALLIFVIVALTAVTARLLSRETRPISTPTESSESATSSSSENLEIPPLDLRIAFGYKDARPARFVGDRNERLVLIERFTAECGSADQACGFSRDPEDGDLLEKTVLRPDGRYQTIYLRITESSVGPDDVANRQDPFQKWQSEASEMNFLTGLESADFVLYIGHSRDGGGPAFTPPKILKNSHVDYNHYIRVKEGARKMIAVLEKTKSPPKVVGLLSCYSERHFVKALNRAAPRTKLITNDHLLYYAEALSEAGSAVDDFIQAHLANP
jgi:hypothetical protein